MSADEQRHPPDLRQIGEQAREPDLPDKARGTDQQNVLSAERLAHREVCSTVARIKMDDRHVCLRHLPPSPLNRAIQRVWIFREPQMPQQSLAVDATVRLVSAQP